MIEFQSLISLFDGFSSAVKAYENFKKVSAIIRGEPDKIDVALQHLENINNKLEVVRLSEHIVQVPSIQSVRDITQTRQRQIELTEVRESLDPLQRALNSDLLASAMILTPEKMRQALGKNPWEVLEDISPVNLARPHYDPNKVPIIFEHQSVRYLGWLKRGLLPVVFDCQFEDLPLNVPQRPEIITPPPIISSSNNEEQRLQQLRNQTAELERQRKLEEQRRENQIKTREEEKQLQAQIREEQIKQYILQHGQLSAWNPFDWWRLLVWVLWSPIYLKIYREKYGTESEKYTVSWLASTLMWFPLFSMYLMLVSANDWTTQSYFITIGLIVAWFLTGIVFGHLGEEWDKAKVGVVGVAAFGIALGVTFAKFRDITELGVVDIVVFVAAGLTILVVTWTAEFILVEDIKKSIETGNPSYSIRLVSFSYLLAIYFISLILFIRLLFLVLSLLIDFILFLQGWQYFK